ncbi:hypothetical protein SMB67_003753 [Cronobacter sakazakii]|nr:hypothetical protein [Cronobacter sakazakii]ELY2764100.1 hypothetical protein [Cronobacter sakazakii]
MDTRTLLNRSLLLLTLAPLSIYSHAVTFKIYNEQGVECNYSINEHGFAESEDSGPKGTGVCWDFDMMRKADKFIKDNALKKEAAQDKGTRLIKATFRACSLGSSTQLTPYEKVLSYAKIISEFKGDGYAINRISDSFEKGKNAIGVADFKFCQRVALSP